MRPRKRTRSVDDSSYVADTQYDECGAAVKNRMQTADFSDTDSWSDDSFADSSADDGSGDELGGVELLKDRLSQIEILLDDTMEVQIAEEAHATLHDDWLCKHEQEEHRDMDVKTFLELHAPLSKLLELLVVCKWRLGRYDDAAGCFERYTRYMHAREGEQPFAGESLPSTPNERRSPRTEGKTMIAGCSLASLLARLRNFGDDDAVAQRALRRMAALDREWSTEYPLGNVFTHPLSHSAHPRWRAEERSGAVAAEKPIVPHLAGTPEFARTLAFLRFPRLTRKTPPTLLKLYAAVFVNTPAAVRCALNPFLGYEEKDPRVENIVIDSIFFVNPICEVNIPPPGADAEQESTSPLAIPDGDASAAVEKNSTDATLSELLMTALGFGPSGESLGDHGESLGDRPVCSDNAMLAGDRPICLNKNGEIVENSHTTHRVIAGGGAKADARDRYCDARRGSRVRFNAPSSLCVSTSSLLEQKQQVIFVADTGNHCVRCVNPVSGATTTLELPLRRSFDAVRRPTKVATRFTKIDAFDKHVLAVVADSTTHASGQAVFFFELAACNLFKPPGQSRPLLCAW